MQRICLIPARGGSKRIPRKNIKIFHGKPLIGWSIECALSSNLFQNVYVSTDDNEIADIAVNHGAIVPFLRPKDISDDYAIDKEVIDHFLDWSSKSGMRVDTLCYLYPTAPFITIQTLKECNRLLENTNAREVLTVSKYDYPVLRALKKDNNNHLVFAWEEYSVSRSQDLPEFLHDAGQCYFFNLDLYNKNSNRVGYELPRSNCLDIDTLEDFEIAEKLFALKNM